MQFVNPNKVLLEREMNELDKLVIDFISILKKHVDYVIISGYVSLLFGRSRTTEDVDVFIKELTDKHLAELYENLTEKGYWCINAEELQTISEYLNSGSAVRFAKINSTIPNFEVKFALKQLDLEAFKDFVVVETRLGQLKISSLERQIAYKRFYLKSPKDTEDAEFIENLFKDKLNKDKINKYKILLKSI